MKSSEEYYRDAINFQKELVTLLKAELLVIEQKVQELEKYKENVMPEMTKISNKILEGNESITYLEDRVKQLEDLNFDLRNDLSWVIEKSTNALAPAREQVTGKEYYSKTDFMKEKYKL